ncbi:MAG: low temperature requirement protein A [Solirubrobacteraceae bacterium]
MRVRDGGEQPISAIELFFDLVYVFAITQLSHLLIAHLYLAGVARASLLLLVVWWAWIYTTWMVNWFDPSSPAVRLILVGVGLASLLMAAALPQAFTSHGMLFAGSYVVLQVGRNVAAERLIPRGHALQRPFVRIIVWSLLAGVFWLGGALLSGDERLALWIPALLIELAAPLTGYWTPGLGRSRTDEYDIHGSHFAERCQGFIIIALGESIVVTGATAADAGLTTTVVLALAVAFLQSAALWWLYFGAVAEHSRRRIAASDDPAQLARDAYTYLHLPIIAGVIAVAVGDDLLIKHPDSSLATASATMVLGGPALYLLGEVGFRLRMVRSLNRRRLLTVGALLGLLALAPLISALVLCTLVALLLTLLGVWEYAAGLRDPSSV